MSGKIKKRVVSKRHLNWEYGVSIEGIRKDLDALEKEGFTDIEINYNYSHDNVDITVESYMHRFETDEEYQNRMNKDKVRAEARLAHEKGLYEELRKKFEQ